MCVCVSPVTRSEIKAKGDRVRQQVKLSNVHHIMDRENGFAFDRTFNNDYQ